jgi:hypothetical protein
MAFVFVLENFHAVLFTFQGKRTKNLLNLVDNGGGGGNNNNRSAVNRCSFLGKADFRSKFFALLCGIFRLGTREVEGSITQ